MERILGIVAEYNPFHLGHHYQLQNAIELTGCEYTVIAMSGNFVQRGEPAIMDKWERAQIALAAGADLVVEIPTFFVLQSAEGFARGGISALAACGITHLSFGSESGDLSKIDRLAHWLELIETQQSIKNQLQHGITYAAALQRAVESAGEVRDLAPLLTGANDILAIEYLRAARHFAPDISIQPVQRRGPAHGSLNSGSYASATRLRKLLWQGKDEEALRFIPPAVRALTNKALAGKRVFSEDLTQAVFYALLTMSRKELSRLPACSEGLENRIKNSLFAQKSIEGLIQAIKSKRYPRTRIQRLLLQALLHFQKVAYQGAWTPYLRILGCSPRGKKLLPLLAKQNRAHVIYSARDIANLNAAEASLLALDQRAADIYNLARTELQRDILMIPVGPPILD